MNLSKLKDCFPATDIEWRVQSSGMRGGKPWAMVLAYVTNRAIMERLDTICGPQNWKNEFQPAPGGGILCGISIKCGDEWVTKWDGAENTDIEPIKGGLSGAMKRAAVQWGPGRYLYKLDTGWAAFTENGAHSDLIYPTKEDQKRKTNGKYHKWDPPQLPAWALPVGEKQEVPKQQSKPPAQEPPKQEPPKQTGRPVGKGDEQLAKPDVRIEEKRSEIRTWLLSMTVDDNAKEARALLEYYTTWTNDKGEEVKGKRSVSELSEPQVPVIHRKIKKDIDSGHHPFHEKEVAEKFDECMSKTVNALAKELDVPF